MRLLFVADGQRDRVTIPRIVERILNTAVDVEFREWKRLKMRQGGGYKRKLRFALLLARDQELNGVVATVDSDNAKPRQRLAELRSGRDEDRNKPIKPMPAALGEAVPHLEAWLLDDPKAIKQVLQFASDKVIPDVRQPNPKTSLDALMADSARTEEPMELLAEIACNIDIRRCNHSAETGFDEFVQDVRDELEPVASVSH
jgi:hypothetical protein